MPRTYSQKLDKATGIITQVLIASFGKDFNWDTVLTKEILDTLFIKADEALVKDKEGDFDPAFIAKLDVLKNRIRTTMLGQKPDFWKIGALNLLAIKFKQEAVKKEQEEIQRSVVASAPAHSVPVASAAPAPSVPASAAVSPVSGASLRPAVTAALPIAPEPARLARSIVLPPAPAPVRISAPSLPLASPLPANAAVDSRPASRLRPHTPTSPAEAGATVSAAASVNRKFEPVTEAEAVDSDSLFSNGVLGFFEKGLEMLGGDNTFLGKMVGSVFKALLRSLSPIVKRTAPFLNQLTGMFKPAVESMASFFAGAGASNPEAASPNPLVEQAAPFLSQLMGMFKPMVESVTSFFSGAGALKPEAASSKSKAVTPKPGLKALRPEPAVASRPGPKPRTVSVPLDLLSDRLRSVQGAWSECFGDSRSAEALSAASLMPPGLSLSSSRSVSGLPSEGRAFSPLFEARVASGKTFAAPSAFTDPTLGMSDEPASRSRRTTFRRNSFATEME